MTKQEHDARDTGDSPAVAKPKWIVNMFLWQNKNTMRATQGTAPLYHVLRTRHRGLSPVSLTIIHNLYLDKGL